MGFREIAAKKEYIKPKECEPGEVVIEGFFVQEAINKFGQTQFEFETDDGKIVVLNGSGLLKYKMQFVHEGDYVQVIYDGMEVLSGGTMKGREAHQFTILTDDDRSRRKLTSVASTKKNQVKEEDYEDDLDVLDELDDDLDDL